MTFTDIQDNKKQIIFENVGSNIICDRITGKPQLLDLTLVITPENEKQCLKAYNKNHKLKVIVEWE